MKIDKWTLAHLQQHLQYAIDLEDGVAAGRRITERSNSTDAYRERIATRFRIYAETRARLYEIERRDGPFWQKRRERSRAMVARAAKLEGD